MKTNEMIETIRLKDSLLNRQSKRIELLEDKMSELRKKYFQLKYAGMIPKLMATS